MERPSPGLDPPDGEAGAAVLKDDPGPGCDDPRAELLVEALDERHGHPVGVDGADVHAFRRPGRARAGRGGKARRDVTRIEQFPDVCAVAHPCERVLEREPNARPGSRDPGSRVRATRALRARRRPGSGRQLEHLDAPVRAAKWLHPRRLVRGQVALAQPAGRGDRRCDPPFVEGTRPLERDLPKRLGELRMTESRPTLMSWANSGGRGCRSRLRPYDLPSRTRALRRRSASSQARVEADRPKRSASAPPGDRAGNRDRRGPLSSTGVSGSASIGAGPAVETGDLPAVPDDREASPPMPVDPGSVTQSIAAAARAASAALPPRSSARRPRASRAAGSSRPSPRRRRPEVCAV